MESTTSVQLRELADLLNKFPGVIAREWTPGEAWTMLFTVNTRNDDEFRGCLSILDVLATSNLHVEAVPSRSVDLLQKYYRIGSGPFAPLFAKLADAQKNLWRKH